MCVCFSLLESLLVINQQLSNYALFLDVFSIGGLWLMDLLWWPMFSDVRINVPTTETAGFVIHFDVS